MADDDETDWNAAYQEFALGIRPHAAYWALSREHSANETSVLREFETALEREGQLFFRNPRHRGAGNDPPDCEADDLIAGKIAIELTELVDGEAKYRHLSNVRVLNDGATTRVRKRKKEIDAFEIEHDPEHKTRIFLPLLMPITIEPSITGRVSGFLETSMTTVAAMHRVCITCLLDAQVRLDT